MVFGFTPCGSSGPGSHCGRSFGQARARCPALALLVRIGLRVTHKSREGWERKGPNEQLIRRDSSVPTSATGCRAGGPHFISGRKEIDQAGVPEERGGVPAHGGEVQQGSDSAQDTAGRVTQSCLGSGRREVALTAYAKATGSSYSLWPPKDILKSSPV